MNPVPKINPINTLSHFKNPAAVLPVLCVELFTTAGRTKEAHKRGGIVEAKETFFEDASAAVFWLFGVKTFNKLGDKIGKDVFKLEHLNVDVGKDALRQPFHDVIPKDKQTATALFKFSKIFASVLLATSIVGFVLPKIKQSMTKKAQAKKEPTQQGQPEKEKQTGQNGQQELLMAAVPSMVEFLNSAKNKPAASSLSFKGFVDNICRISHNLENNNTWRLISTDTGMIAGRVKNSRNKIEASEFLFRDTASIYFYMFAAPHTVALLNKLTKTPDVHPKALLELGEHLSAQVKNKPQSVEDFMKKAFGGLKTVMPENIKFDKDDVISLSDLISAIGPSHAAKAELMSQLQPQKAGVSILSKKQVQDILSDGWTSDPKFLKKAISEATYGASDDAARFVSREKVEGIRKSFDDFTEYLAQQAKKQGKKEIDSQFIENFVKKANIKAGLFYAIGFGVAALGLAVLIPKLKNYITKMRTGKDSFPGITEYE